MILLQHITSILCQCHRFQWFSSHFIRIIYLQSSNYSHRFVSLIPPRIDDRCMANANYNTCTLFLMRFIIYSASSALQCLFERVIIIYLLEWMGRQKRMKRSSTKKLSYSSNNEIDVNAVP